MKNNKKKEILDALKKAGKIHGSDYEQKCKEIGHEAKIADKKLKEELKKHDQFSLEKVMLPYLIYSQ